jgi:predicted small secreted protein
MGKKGGVMIKKGLVIFVLLLVVALESGCNTVSGAAKGASDGAKKDWEAAKKTDVWMKKNLW